MDNPWLKIPLDDYERHMALPQVAQAQMLSDIFASALREYRPVSLAVLGCAGGNGFEHIQADVTRRVVGIDINPHYIQRTRERFDGCFPAFELYVGDVQTEAFDFAPVELMFAGLVFEYVFPDTVFARTRMMLCPGGVFMTVVQLPSETVPEVTPSPFASLSELSSTMHLVDPETLTQVASARGFRAAKAHTVEAAGGKRFRVQTFVLEANSNGPASRTSVTHQR